MTISLSIPSDLAAQRLDKALAALVVEPPLSRARIQALLAQGHVRLGDGVVSDSSRKVKVGEVYTLTLPPPEKAEMEAQPLALDILYEDQDVIVINKQAGLVVHPAPGHRDQTLVNALLAHCGNTLSGIGGVARPGIVHRLDKDTSGLMVVAKNDAAHQALAAQFADRSLSRIYHALVWGVPTPPSGSLDGSIGRSPKDRKKMAVTAKGRVALTHYRMMESFGAVSLIECKLATGRTHQIRVHLAHLGHPLVGDPTYGKGKSGKGVPSFPRQALHAKSLRFIHPRTGQARVFDSPLPEDMQGLIKKLKTPL